MALEQVSSRDLSVKRLSCDNRSLASAVQYPYKLYPYWIIFFKYSFAGGEQFSVAHGPKSAEVVDPNTLPLVLP